MKGFDWVNGLSKEVRVAIIGSVSTILAALISGAFIMLNAGGSETPSPISTVGAPVEADGPRLSEPTALSASVMPSATAAETPGVTATVGPVRVEELESGLLFATRILPNGLALDPGNQFGADIHELYAVFRPGALPPGLEIFADNPHPDFYYAILVPRQGSGTSSIGWRWYLNGELVNDFSMDLEPGVGYWLGYQDQRPGGIFLNSHSPGEYRIVITLGGNAVTSARVTILNPLAVSPIPLFTATP